MRVSVIEGVPEARIDDYRLSETTHRLCPQYHHPSRQIQPTGIAPVPKDEAALHLAFHEPDYINSALLFI